jgi:hypothetical protein
MIIVNCVVAVLVQMRLAVSFSVLFVTVRLQRSRKTLIAFQRVLLIGGLLDAVFAWAARAGFAVAGSRPFLSPA